MNKHLAGLAERFVIEIEGHAEDYPILVVGAEGQIGQLGRAGLPSDLDAAHEKGKWIGDGAGERAFSEVASQGFYVPLPASRLLNPIGSKMRSAVGNGPRKEKAPRRGKKRLDKGAGTAKS